jgi:hypothetical protein
MSSLQVALLAIAAALVSAVAVLLWVRARRRSPWGEALVVATLPLCVYAVLAVAIVKTSHVGEGHWSTARLTPSVALVRGHEVYSTREEGALQTTLYPPLWVVSYLPVAVGATPSEVLRIGLVLTLLFSFLPVVLLLGDHSPTAGLGVLGSTSFVVASLWIDSLEYSLFHPHADAPSLGYAMAACWWMLRSGALTKRRLALVALLAWFSVLSKQVMVPILVALPVWLLLVHGRRQCLRLVGWLTVTGGVAAAFLLPFFDLEGVIFNCLTIPARVPWQAEHLKVVMGLRVLAELFVHCVPLLLLLATCAVASIALRSPSAGPRAFLARNPWTLLAGVALFMVPVSVLGRIKVGGAINTLSPTTFFLFAAGILAVLAVVRRSREEASPRVHQTGLGAAALCAGILAAGGTAEVVLESDSPLREYPAQQAYTYLVRQDSRAHFPLHPLAHLLADGSLFHYGSSIYDRERLARLPMSRSQREGYLPEDPTIVCWDEQYWGETWLPGAYFTEYTRRVDPPRLGSYWECYAR